MLVSVPFTEADPVSHILWRCPLTWQDYFNFHEKGMTLVDMRLLLMFLEVLECIGMQEKSIAQSDKKNSNKSKKGNKQVPKKACTKKHCNLCKKHGGAHTMHNTRDCGKYEKDGSEKVDFCATKKGRKKPNPQISHLCS
jgi:hypothetical protein